MSEAIPPASRARIRRALLRHFEANRRPMPWRRTRDPYRIWLSEVLLQQTRVAAALPYYRRFLKRFPTIRKLAAAPLRDVLREWAGLGYYARARNLHACARALIDGHGGRIPATRAELLALPGIGPYTAGALLSFVHGQREAVVDGNIARVLTRLFRIAGDPRSQRVMKRLRWIAADLVPARRSRDFNLAIMDLGAGVCLPRSPRCGECPVRAVCTARRAGEVERFPQTAPPRRPVRVERLVAVMESRGRLFLVPRPEGGLLGGMWELPGADGGGRRPAARLSRRLSGEWGVPVRAAGEIAVAEHGITYRRITYRAFRASMPEGGGTGAGRWIRRRDLGRYPVSTATRKILARLEGVSPCGRSTPATGS